MQKTSTIALARELAEIAASSTSGRASRTIYGGHEHALRQTVIALAVGNRLDEHENPGEATIFVLRGRLRLTTSAASWDAMSGDHLTIPDARHDVLAVEDCAFLLTVAMTGSAEQGGS